ncbi:MAG: GPW/gp25 family protein [Rhodobacteraceae bacterium]|nr:GPW/gp25 family protein [Paracoccaceae bacterium]
MSGMGRDTGRRLGDRAHLAQSIIDILSTPKGARVMRRDYGSDLPALIDAPINGETVVDLVMATAEAIATWEPRYVLRRVEIDEARPGHASLRLTGEVLGLSQVIDVTVGGAA